MWRRVRVYFVGVGLGCLLVYFFLIRGKGRDFGFWLPENRVIHEISESNMSYHPKATCELACFSLSHDSIPLWIKQCEVNFSQSLTREKPKKYLLQHPSGFCFWIQKDSRLQSQLISVTSCLKKRASCSCS